ncbi:terpene synthase family protein [Streptomyces muensis]|uniref:Terpene synthase n=1 Tax=Streptomyces muensis TaxID=1077944 RepID=A0A9X1PSA0_STRM4|nr:hypothetical protein [Streptomyces muensis]MCF1592178.1 hypothetical protein [Streptomyces muensis]
MAQPLDLPSFYTPCPARLNPNLEAARVHTRQWAQSMGMLGTPVDEGVPKVWGDCAFEAMDYALLCAYTHPDAPAPELDLVTDWYVWVFYFDDHFLQVFKRTRDMDGARQYLARLPSFMPPDGGAPSLEPVNPVERGLADLWARTVPGPPPAGVHRGPPEGRRRPLVGGAGRARGQRPRPGPGVRLPTAAGAEDFIEMRRLTAGTDLTAIYLLLTAGRDLPAELHEHRVMRELVNTFGDQYALINDIYSYRREIDHEGEVDNSVLVVRDFLDCPLQTAVDIVGDLAWYLGDPPRCTGTRRYDVSEVPDPAAPLVALGGASRGRAVSPSVPLRAGRGAGPGR